TPQFFTETGNNQTIFLITGILISFLIALIINSQKLQVLTVKRLVKEQTTELIKSESLTSTILRSAVDAIINTKSDGTITSFNPAATALFGYNEDEIIGQNISILISEPHRSLHDGYIRQYLQTKETKVIGSVRELEGLHKEGTLIPISLSLSKVELDDEISFTGIIHDLTDIKAAQLALKSQKFAMDQHSIIATTDVKGTITYVNEKFCEISGYQKDELMGKNHRLLNSGNQHKEYWKKMYQTVASGQVWNDEIQNKSKDGGLYWVDTTIVPIMDKNNKPCRYISIRTDITDLKQLQHNLKSTNTKLKVLSETDPLTKISNRRVYEERLRHEVQSSRNTGQPLSLLMIDIDFFKPYNDNYGHDAGDLALFKVAESLVNSLCRPADIAARFGGEEFVVLAPSTNEAGAIKVAKRIQFNINALAITHDFSEVTNTITVSIGIATTNGHSLNEADLLKQADTALYKAKKSGRNRFEVKSSV
ncbi:MAG: diguanylate cyclase, partial [Thiotrichaceae bacterium]|nr:diguanylate cyclase [Thiotrichaceae bacterium]